MGRGSVDDGLAHGRDELVVGEVGVEPFPGEHLPQDDPQREDIDAPVLVLAADLFWGHVAVLAAHLALLAALGAALGFGDAEVDQLHFAAVPDEDVLRADVAVDDAEQLAAFTPRLVSSVEALGGAERDVGGELGSELARSLPEAGHQRRQGDPMHVLHGQVVEAVLLAELVDAHHVRVPDPNRDQRLVDEPPHRLPVGGEVRVDHFDRNGFVRAGAGGEIEGRHPALRDAGDQLELPDSAAHPSTLTAAAGRDDLDASAAALPVRGCGHAVELREREVDDATVPSGHRLERDDLALVDGALGLTESERLEVRVVPVAVVSRVHDDVPSPVRVTVEDFVQQELERVERLPLLADDAPGVFAGHVEHDALVVLADVHVGVELHQLEHLVEELGRFVRFAVSGGSVGAFAAAARVPITIAVTVTVFVIASALGARRRVGDQEGAILGFVVFTLSHGVASSCCVSRWSDAWRRRWSPRRGGRCRARDRLWVP